MARFDLEQRRSALLRRYVVPTVLHLPSVATSARAPERRHFSEATVEAISNAYHAAGLSCGGILGRLGISRRCCTHCEQIDARRHGHHHRSTS